MRLSINGWPPLASHIACILIGGALTHLNSTDNHSEQETYSPNRKVILNFNPREIQLFDIHPGEPGLIARRDQDQVCLTGLTKVYVTASKSRIQISASTHSFPAVLAAADVAAVGKLAIVGASSEKNYPLCRNQPKVNYGMP